METDEYQYFVGIDWATKAHEISVIDGKRTVLATFAVEHSASGIQSLVDRLLRIGGGNPVTVAIGIETPRGALVETLMDRGFPVFSLNPKQSDRFRDRHRVAGTKDDRLDAFVIADSLRTDRPCFHRVQVQDPLIIQLRELSRASDDLTQEMTRLTNRLREQLYRYFPQLLTLAPAADEPWLWTLLAAATTPERARRLSESKLNRILTDHHIRRLTADAVLSVLRGPAIYVAPGTVEAAASHVRLLLPRLRLIQEQRTDCERAIKGLLDQLGGIAEDAAPGQLHEHGDVAIILSLPGVGIKTAATVLAEAAEALATRDYPALRARAGIAPVTRRSGGRIVIQMRRACVDRLRNALYHAARVHVQSDPHARAIYAALRARGHSHGRACRTIADRMLRILFAMLKSRTLYDATRQVPAPTEQPQKAAA